ncbi:MAG: hypothetical protein HYS78_00230 [Parcubacteria group bacterium]|nr:hypothetical protein [Parcubacteria group bacterium]
MKRRVFIGLFVLLVLGTAVFLLYQSRFREGRVALTLEAPESASSGEEIEYKLTVENKNNFDLLDVGLSFFYPEGSVPLNEDGQPLNSLVNNLDLGVLESRGKKEFSFRAVISGEKGEVKKAKANLTYSPSSFRSVFQKSEEAGTSVSRVSVPLILSAPPSVLPGQSVQVSLDLRNETEEDLGDFQVVFSYPDGFSFKKAAPLPDEGTDIFNLYFLKAGEGVRISVEGEISGFEKEGKKFAAVLKKKIGGRYFDIQKAQTLLTVSSPLLAADVLVNDSKDFIAGTGDRLKYTVRFANNSNNNFSALELSAKLEGQLFDFSSIKTDGFFDQNTNTILWNAASTPLLSNLAPNQDGQVSFDVVLKNDFPRTFSKNYSLKVSSLLQTSSVPPDFNLDRITASAELIIRVRAKTEFTSRAFYGDSVFPNSGPTPPKVGQKTTYAVHWKIINEGGDLTNVRITSFLLPGIVWENNSNVAPSQSEIRFDPSLGRVSWVIPTVPAGTGAISPVFEAVFQVGITPGVNQAGQAPEILKEAVLEAIDNFTKENVNLSQPGINTTAISDSPGTVQP